jgi:DTW domain-containing protein
MHGADIVPSRESCLRCRRPLASCLCPTLPPMETASRVVLLMHPKEYKRQKTGTGRLACINLAKAEILPGLAFDSNPRVRELVDDPANRAFLLYPSPGALDLGEARARGELASELEGRNLVVFLIDSTWACARAVLRESPGIAGLPRLRFQPAERSRWIIKRQPRDYCLSTIEAIHELLCALEDAGLDSYPDKGRLLGAFAALQAYQVGRAEAARAPRFLHSR